MQALLTSPTVASPVLGTGPSRGTEASLVGVMGLVAATTLLLVLLSNPAGAASSVQVAAPEPHPAPAPATQAGD